MNSIRSVATFPDTRWSVVLRARGKDVRDEGATLALDELCAAYWYPLYAYARGCGQSATDAEDLTQGFFERVVTQDLFARVDPTKGRLRSFLLGSFKYYMSEEWHQARRQKRGGGRVLLNIDQVRAEEWYHAASLEGLSPDALFDRSWFSSLIEKALDELEQEHRRRGKEALFHRLQDFLAWDSGDQPLAELATELGMSSGALRVTIFRMRQRFRTLLERQVADTSGSAEDAGAEMQHMRRMMQ